MNEPPILADASAIAAPVVVPAQAAMDIVQRFKLSDQGRALLDHEQTPAEFLSVLVDHECYADAVRLLAYGLQPHNAAWWGCLCAWHVLRQQESPADAELTALEATVHWLLDPTDDNRREADRAARVAGTSTLAGGIAKAAFFSSGSISLPDQPEVPPPPGVTARLVASALNRSIALGKTAEPQRARQFLRIGLDVAQGRNIWPF